MVNIKDGTIHSFLGQFLNGGTWIRLLLINDFECIKAFHLWFLPALIYAYIILYITIEKYKVNIEPKIIAVILIARIIVLSFINTNGLSWHLSGNWLVFGVPYIFVGYAIATKLDVIKKYINLKVNIILIVSSALAEIVCFFISLQVNITEIFVVCNAISIFVFAVRNDVKIRCVPLEIIGNKYSLNIYVGHIFVNGVIAFAAGVIGIRESKAFIWLNPLIVLISTLVLSIFIEVIKNKLFNSRRIIMNIKEELQEIFREVFFDDTIELFDEMTSDDVEDWDSLSHISLISEIEKHFNIGFTTDEIMHTKNVGEFIKIIEIKVN